MTIEYEEFLNLSLESINEQNKPQEQPQPFDTVSSSVLFPGFNFVDGELQRADDDLTNTKYGERSSR